MGCYDGDPKISDLIGKTFKTVTQDGEEMKFVLEDGTGFVFHHHQGCCESVSIEDVCGDLSDLEGSPITMAEEIESDPPKVERDYEPDSETWTFYKFATEKGYVTVRWYGTSNGYYGESCDLCTL